MSAAAAGLIALSALLHACWNVAARRVGGDLAAIWLGLCLAAAAAAPVALALCGWPTRSSWPLLAATAACHVVYFLALASAYQTGDVSQVYPIARGTGVAGTAVAAWLVMGEKLGLVAGVGVAAICAGVLLIGAAPRALRLTAAVRRAFVVGASMVGYSLVDKKAVARVHPLLYVWCLFALVSVLLSPYVLRRHGGRLAQVWRESWRACLLIGLASMATYLLVLFAFRLGPVGRLVAFRELAVVIGATMGVVFLRESWTARKAAGLLVVAAGLVLVKLGP